MNKSYAAAGLLVVVLVLWMASGLFRTDDSSSNQSDSSNSDAAKTQLMKVQVSTLAASVMNRELTLQGQVEPKRHLMIRSETTGTIRTLPITKGSRVKAGDLLVKLSLDGRDSKLAEAQAKIRTALSEEKAAKKLQKQGLQSQLKLEQVQASLATARTALNQTRRDIANTEIKAPFDGILNDLPVELGEQLERGTVVADLVDDSSFIVTATATQQTIQNLKVGQVVEARLITGDSLPGKITFISAIADPRTRSFEIEAEVENTDANVAAGVSASLVVPVESVSAFFLSPSTISLGPDGEIGVKTVNADDIVEFHPIKLVQTSQDGAWVTGVPDGTKLITLGQGFVAPGQQVETIDKPSNNTAG